MNTIHCCERSFAKMAVRALYFEVKAYPKPGLVSFIDTGAHQDMNGETFFRSLFTLRHYFYQITKQGLGNYSFSQLKSTAIEAELRMFDKTQGINTHRGAIFSLGLLCVSSARLAKRQKIFMPIDLHQQLIKDWQIALTHHRGNANSHGALVRQEYKIIDAKQMAIRGYDLVFNLLPSFIALFIETQSIDEACLMVYLELLLRIDDTNILYRKGRFGLDYAKENAAHLLAIACRHARYQESLKLHQLFSDQGISPGGVADLIAVLFFLGQLFCEPLRCH